MLNQRKLRKKSRAMARDCQGWQLAETLFGVIIATVIMYAVMSDLLSFQRFAVGVQNQALAADIVQEIMDNARNMTYAQLQSFASSTGSIHTLLVNKTSASQSTDTFFPRPLEQDQTTLTYSAAGKANVYPGDSANGGSVVATLTDNTSTSGSITVSVVLTWNEGGHRNKKLTASTVISENGIHN